MAHETTLEKGREAFRKQAWSDAYSLLSSADRENSLEPDNLELLAKAAYLSGKYFECTDTWNRAHHAYLKKDKKKRAANCAFWLGLILLTRGAHAQGNGWIARADRLVADMGQDCVEEGFLLVPKALKSLNSGNHQKAYGFFNKAADIGGRFQNPDLITLGRLGCGQALVMQNKISEGTTLFDEVMVAVLSDEISPIVSGIVYCAVIETCQMINDLKRAREWTDALSRWCESQPDLVPFRGQCLVRRVEIMQLHGEWQDAMNEVQRACELLSGPPGEPAAGEAWYRQGELFRLSGNDSMAEEMYRRASNWGRTPQPGLSLLRLAQEMVKDASAAIRQSEREKKDPVGRSEILPAYVEIMIADNNIRAARAAAEELAEIAKKIRAPYLQAVATRTVGTVLLVMGESCAALDKLRQAWSTFKTIDASYESAKTRVLIGRACRELGDNDTSEMELDAARRRFKQMGALPDLKAAESLLQKSPPDPIHGLTPRELEVLRFLATGKTNKTIAADLFISERTVDRHVSNILSKLNVSSRAAATAYAYEHHLI